MSKVLFLDKYYNINISRRNETFQDDISGILQKLTQEIEDDKLDFPQNTPVIVSAPEIGLKISLTINIFAQDIEVKSVFWQKVQLLITSKGINILDTKLVPNY